MFIVTWKHPQLCIHYQCPINPDREKPEWSWGPADGSFLVRCSEAHALALITSKRYSFSMEVAPG